MDVLQAVVGDLEVRFCSGVVAASMNAKLSFWGLRGTHAAPREPQDMAFQEVCVGGLGCPLVFFTLRQYEDFWWGSSDVVRAGSLRPYSHAYLTHIGPPAHTQCQRLVSTM